MKRVILTVAAVLAIAVVSVVVFAGTATAGPPACDNRVNSAHAKLLECVTLDGVRGHQAAFQAIADANNGIRTSGTSGYDASKDYVVAKMTEYGYNVSVQEFQFNSPGGALKNRDSSGQPTTSII